MNYIKQLQAEKAELEAKLAIANATIDSFTVFLHGSKFTGRDPDGSRKDWIATSDLLHWLRETRSELNA